MNYPIPLYLNQKYVFDILAMIEDGFSQIQSLKTFEDNSTSSSNKIRGEVGLSNVFAFLGVKLQGETESNSKDNNQSAIETQKVHTPNSLFAKMLNNLDKRGLIKKENILNTTTGDFVIFKSTLRKNPIIDNFESYSALFRLAFNFSDNSQQNKQQKLESQANKRLLEQFDNLLQQLKSEGSLDIISDSTGDEKFKAVLTIDRDYLNDPSLSDIADGEFYVFGKTIKIIKEGSESINLLRKTSLSKFSDATLKGIFESFQGMNEHGLKNADFTTEIQAPVLQVIPIAIFA